MTATGEPQQRKARGKPTKPDRADCDVAAYGGAAMGDRVEEREGPREDQRLENLRSKGFFFYRILKKSISPISDHTHTYIS